MYKGKCKCIACKRRLRDAKTPNKHKCILCGNERFFYWTSSRYFLPDKINIITKEYKKHINIPKKTKEKGRINKQH